MNTGDFTHTLHNMTFFQNTLRIDGRILWHISITGHCRRRYTWFTQLCICPRNTLKIHGRVLWPKPVTLNNFIINTGHCRRLYTRFTLLCEAPQNTLKIHGRVLIYRSRPKALYSYPTIIGAPVDRSRYLVQYPRPCFAHRPDSSSVFT